MSADHTTSNGTPGGTTDRGVAAARRSSRMVLVAVAAAGVALLAGLSVLAFDPSEGSRLETILSVTAAASGIASGALIAAAAINAQALGGWEHFPVWVRRTAMAALVAIASLNLVRWLL